MAQFTTWAQTEHPFHTRLAATLLLWPLFVILLPLLIGLGGRRIDHRLGLSGFFVGPANLVAGGLTSAAGLAFAYWTIYAQLTRGRGTPLPLLPTQELLTQGPFRFCRNPMTLGTILGYLGVAIAFGAFSGIALVLTLAALLLLYITRIEERELAQRFGADYLEYRRQVPLLIPRIPACTGPGLKSGRLTRRQGQ